MEHVWIVERKYGNKWHPITDEVYYSYSNAEIAVEALNTKLSIPMFRLRKYIREE